MKTIKERRLDFINTELGYFIEDPSRRAYNKETKTCMYWDKTTGNKCVVGRHIPEDKYSQVSEGMLVDTEKDDGGLVIFNLLPLELQELGVTFLARCQEFHDSEDNFTETGLSEEGIKELAIIKKAHCGVN